MGDQGGSLSGAELAAILGDDQAGKLLNECNPGGDHVTREQFVQAVAGLSDEAFEIGCANIESRLEIWRRANTAKKVANSNTNQKNTENNNSADLQLDEGDAKRNTCCWP